MPVHARKLCLCLLLTGSVTFQVGCFSRKLGFQPKAAPELSSKAVVTDLPTNWLDMYNKKVRAGECADGSASKGGVCPDNLAYAESMRAFRNSFIDAIRLKIDENYSNFRENVNAGNAIFNLGSDLSVIGLSGAAAAVSDAGLKSILAIASGGVTGGTASYQKEVLNQQNALAVVAAMDAARSNQELRITESELLDINKYTMEGALVDLRQYYSYGTLLGGLLYIQGQMQSNSQNCKNTTQTVKNTQKPVTGAAPSQQPCPAPSAPISGPTHLAATLVDGKISISWTAVSGATSYNIYRGTSPGTEAAAPYKTGILVTNYTDAGATAGATYFFQVTAVTAEGESVKSNEANITLP